MPSQQKVLYLTARRVVRRGGGGPQASRERGERGTRRAGPGPPEATERLVYRGLRTGTRRHRFLVMILPQVHLRKPCYDFYFL
jgi:hypothetical protein